MRDAIVVAPTNPISANSGMTIDLRPAVRMIGCRGCALRASLSVRRVAGLGPASASGSMDSIVMAQTRQLSRVSRPVSLHGLTSSNTRSSKGARRPGRAQSIKSSVELRRLV